MMNDIYLLIKRGYSNEEISETLGVSTEDVNNVRISCVRTPTKNKFSKTCINVFCKFLERGISDEQLYQLFRLRKKCKKEDFCMLCQKLRKGQIHTDITSQYNIPLEPTVTLDLDKYETPKAKPKKPKTFNEDLYAERREIAKKKREKEKQAIAEAQERKRKEDEEKAEMARKLAEVEAAKKAEEEKKKEEAKKLAKEAQEKSIHMQIPEKPLPVLDTTPSNINSDEKIHKVCTLLNKGYTYDEIQKLTSIPVSTIIRIHDGEAYTDISAKYGIISKKTRERMKSLFKDIG